MEQAGITSISVPEDFLVGKMLAHNVVDTESGEILAKANDEITDEVLQKLRAPASKRIQTIYTNELDQGPYISQTLRIDETADQLGRAGRDLPHDAPRRAADRGRGRDAVQRPVLLADTLRPVGGRAHEVQPPRRARATRGRGARSSNEDIVDVVTHPGRPAQRPRRDRRHRPPRQPARALRRRAGREPVPRRAWCASSGRSRSASARPRPRR